MKVLDKKKLKTIKGGYTSKVWPDGTGVTECERDYTNRQTCCSAYSYDGEYGRNQCFAW